MAITGIIIIVAVLILLVWTIVEFKRMRHKFFALFLIGLILFVAITFSVAIKGKSVEFKTAKGVENAFNIYVAWLGSAFGNFKTVTTYAVKMDWSGSNQTSSKG